MSRAARVGLSVARRAEAQRELDRTHGDRKAAALVLLGRKWTVADVELAVGRSEAWVRRLTSGRPVEIRRYVKCACGWGASRSGTDPCAKLCPRCGDRPRLGKRKGRTIKAIDGGRVRVTALVAPETVRALERAGGKSTQAARLLDSWAASVRPKAAS